MVSIWLTRVKGDGESSARKKSASQRAADFLKNAVGSERRLLAVLLDPRGAQPRKAMLVDGKLPGQEFVDGQRVAAESLLKGEEAAATPPTGAPNIIFPPGAMRLCHGVLTNSQPLNSQVATYAQWLKICLSPGLQ